MNSSPSNLKVLRWVGFLGHRYVVIEPSEHWTSVAGWCCCSECSTKESAVRDLKPEQKVFERRRGGWYDVTPKKTLPRP